jgi:threonine dehydrogenase-like Zn-dependent dehydrogenase
VRFGETVVIVGVGAQGLATVIAAKEAGAFPIIAVGRTRNASKWDLAREFGANYLINTDEEDPIAAVERLTEGCLADVVVETTGAGPMMQLGLQLVRPAGRYILIGTCGFSPTPLVTDLIVFRELEVVGGLGQSLDTEEAVRIINSRKYSLHKIITHVFPLDQADEAMNFYIRGGAGVNRVAIRPW